MAKPLNYSTLRKKLQKEGEVPEWFTTAGLQLFYEKYSYNNETVRSRFASIAKALAQHAPKVKPAWWDTDPYTQGKDWEEVMFNTLWDGFVSASTPLLANGGIRKRGTTVACSGGYVGNNLYDRYDSITESAILTKHSHGTSYDIDDWPSEGTPLPRGGNSLGVMPLVRDFISCMNEVTQGSRRGSLAYFIRPQHGDFEKVLLHLLENPESNNVGWKIDDDFIHGLDAGEDWALHAVEQMLGVKLPRGKGYFMFIDKMNRHLAGAFKRAGLRCNATNLCVAPETQILTRTGYVPIAEVAGETLDIWNGEEWSEVTPVQTGENQKLLKVSTSSGHTLECTEYHKWYVLEDYSKPYVLKRTHELEEGDRLIKFDLPVVEGEKTLNYAYDNGFFSGDGSHAAPNNHRPIIYLYGEKRDLKKNLPSVDNWAVSDKNDRDVGRTDKLKDKFFVPSSEYTVQSRLDWLAGYLDADGCVYRNGTTESLTACSVEYSFLQEVQLMLQTLGVSAKISTLAEEGYRPLPKNDGSGESGMYSCKKSYRLLITSYDSYKLCSLGLKFNRLKIKTRRPQRDAKGFNRVVSVVDEGRFSDTYCFTEHKRSMGMFNGILTGNCTETVLPSSVDYTFSCVILNYNLELYDTWPEHLVQIGQIMSDCNVSEYIETINEMSQYDSNAMRKIKRFTEEFRSLGSGVLGLHTLFQMKRIVVGSIESFILNGEIFSRLDRDSLEASKWLAEVQGEPLGCKGMGIRNATRLMMPPTKSTAEIMAGASEGIGLDTAMVFTKQSAGGELFRINKVLLGIMKDRGVYDEETVNRIAVNRSVSKEDFLSDHEKAVFRTAFEVPMESHLQLCAQRQPFIDQAQSINLYFTSNDSEEYMSKIHKQAFDDENILSLYYIYSMRNAGDLERADCEMCQ